MGSHLPARHFRWEPLDLTTRRPRHLQLRLLRHSFPSLNHVPYPAARAQDKAI